MSEFAPTLRERTVQILFSGSSRAARTFDVLLLVAILVSVAVVVIDSLSGLGTEWRTRLRTTEVVS